MIRLIFRIILSLFHKRPVLKDSFLKKIQTGKRVLEIGPFTVPCLRGEHVYYFDVLNTPGLVERAIKYGYPVTDAPEIHFVSPTGDLTIIDQIFDIVLSSHCIEHQPNLVKHLMEVSNILNAAGRYFLIIPDKRYCFDALLPESNIASVIDAHNQNKTVHSLKSVIEHRALTTHNNARMHWMGKNGRPGNVLARIKDAIKEFEDANGEYIDVHAWQFTPCSFRDIIQQLNELNYINLKLCEIYYTSPLKQEFYVVLEKANLF